MPFPLPRSKQLQGRKNLKLNSTILEKHNV